MFSSKIFFIFLLVNQLLQISSAFSCGNDAGLPYKERTRSKRQRPKGSYANPYNLPWTVEIICFLKGRTPLQTNGAIISPKHILGKMRPRQCDYEFMKMRFYSRSRDPGTVKGVNKSIISMEPIEDAPHLALITLEDEFIFEGQNFAACLPNKGDSISDFEGQFIYSRSTSGSFQYRTYIDSKENCSRFTEDDDKFCSGYKNTRWRYIRFGKPGTVERDGKHFLLGIAYSFANNGYTIVYQNVAKHVETIRKQMTESVDKSRDSSTSVDDTNSASGKSSSIYEVVNKNANK